MAVMLAGDLRFNPVIESGFGWGSLCFGCESRGFLSSVLGVVGALGYIRVLRPLLAWLGMVRNGHYV